MEYDGWELWLEDLYILYGYEYMLIGFYRVVFKKKVEVWILGSWWILIYKEIII